MRGTNVSDWLTIQLFLSDDGVCEVLGNHDDYRKMKCTCAAYTAMTKCKHVKHMRKTMDDNGGILNVSIPADAPEEDVEGAMGDTEQFRSFMLKYGKIEYLP